MKFDSSVIQMSFRVVYSCLDEICNKGGSVFEAKLALRYFSRVDVFPSEY